MSAAATCPGGPAVAAVGRGVLVAIVAAVVGVGAARGRRPWSDERTRGAAAAGHLTGRRAAGARAADGGAAPSRSAARYGARAVRDGDPCLATWGVADAAAQPTATSRC